MRGRVKGYGVWSVLCCGVVCCVVFVEKKEKGR